MSQAGKKSKRIDREMREELISRVHQMKEAGAPADTASDVSQTDFLRSIKDDIEDLKAMGFSFKQIAEGLKLSEEEVISASTIAYAMRQADNKAKGRKKAARKAPVEKEANDGATKVEQKSELKASDDSSVVQVEETSAPKLNHATSTDNYEAL